MEDGDGEVETGSWSCATGISNAVGLADHRGNVGGSSCPPSLTRLLPGRQQMTLGTQSATK